jgi:hypothetical protein
MELWVGTSGYSQGVEGHVLSRCCQTARCTLRRYPAVEINNTFYRLPKIDVLESWRTGPPEFRFVKACGDHPHQRLLCRGRNRLPVSVPSPGPIWSCPVPGYLLPERLRLRSLLISPRRARRRPNFRHPSWLRTCADPRRATARCTSPTDEDRSRPSSVRAIEAIRLRKGSTPEGIAALSEQVKSQGWKSVRVLQDEGEAAGQSTPCVHRVGSG